MEKKACLDETEKLEKTFVAAKHVIGTQFTANAV